MPQKGKEKCKPIGNDRLVYKMGLHALFGSGADTIKKGPKALHIDPDKSLSFVIESLVHNLVTFPTLHTHLLQKHTVTILESHVHIGFVHYQTILLI